MEKIFDPAREHRLFNSEGRKIEPRNDGDNFRSRVIDSLIDIVRRNHINIQSILDFGSGQSGGLGKGIAEILHVSPTDLHQFDLEADEESDVRSGNIITTEGLSSDRFDLGLLIQVLRDIENPEDVRKALINLFDRSKYSVITNISSSISLAEGELYFGFQWVDKSRSLATISTKFFDGSIHEYKRFYVHDRQKIEDVIRQSCQKIMHSENWIYNGQPIYNYWITRNT